MRREPGGDKWDEEYSKQKDQDMQGPKAAGNEKGNWKDQCGSQWVGGEGGGGGLKWGQRRRQWPDFRAQLALLEWNGRLLCG